MNKDNHINIISGREPSNLNVAARFRSPKPPNQTILNPTLVITIRSDVHNIRVSNVPARPERTIASPIPHTTSIADILEYRKPNRRALLADFPQQLRRPHIKTTGNPYQRRHRNSFLTSFKWRQYSSTDSCPCDEIALAHSKPLSFGCNSSAQLSTLHLHIANTTLYLSYVKAPQRHIVPCVHIAPVLSV